MLVPPISFDSANLFINLELKLMKSTSNEIALLNIYLLPMK